jgi:ribose transport system ATP-binding protein
VQPTSLETLSLRKEYPGTVALDGVSLRLEGGCVHALVGKNGAGKSTLVKILTGAVQPTAGTIRVGGRDVVLPSPRAALHQGIAAVYQELSLIPELTVAENILLGRMPRRRGSARWAIDWRGAFERAAEHLERLHIALDVRAKVRSLSVAAQQTVEIAKAMSYDPAVLMFDEPTSALAQRESDRLFELIRSLAERGVVLLYITHRLQELGRIADTVSVLRNGTLAGTIPLAEALPGRIAEMMFGDVPHVSSPPPARLPQEGPELLRVEGLTGGGVLKGISFSLGRGEILGLAGLLGSGRTELLRALFGADPPESGRVLVEGQEAEPSNPARMKRLGIGFTPENRKEEGLVQCLSTRANLCLANLESIAHRGFTTRAREQRQIAPVVRTVGIQAHDLEAPISVLSGGNQQKVTLGKWLTTEPKLLLLDEPTRGIDVRAKVQVFDLVRTLSARGIGCIVVSSELEELLELCHRILIMKEGRITGEVRPDATTVHQLFERCLQ